MQLVIISDVFDYEKMYLLYQVLGSGQSMSGVICAITQ